MKITQRQLISVIEKLPSKQEVQYDHIMGRTFEVSFLDADTIKSDLSDPKDSVAYHSILCTFDHSLQEWVLSFK